MAKTKFFGAFSSKEKADKKASEKNANVKTITVRGKTRYAVIKKG